MSKAMNENSHLGSNSYINHINQFVPELLPRFLTLLPFEDVLTSVSAGPQKGEDIEPYFCLDFSEWRDGECLILKQFHVQKERVFLKTFDGDLESSLRQLWDFLRQLPRDPYSFTFGSIV